MDLSQTVNRLASDCPEGSKIEFLAIYLPEDGIGYVRDVAVQKRKTL